MVLKASLAGGVVVGASASIIVLQYGAMIAGFVTGCFTAFGYAYLTPFLEKKLHIHDTAGVVNLFIIPGFAGGVISAIVASFG